MTLLQTMATYATLWTISDLVEQKFICKKRKLDYQKSLRMFTTGTFVMAPLIHTWMFLVEKRFPGRTFKTVAQKMIAGQVVFAPFAISTFYFSKLFKVTSVIMKWTTPDSFVTSILHVQMTVTGHSDKTLNILSFFSNLHAREKIFTAI